ncbi:MAG: YjjG family noncanonical pyrimidine nucleotidase [bacterium]|nr:YjjG family noncanonical pyrimidine nucleotidase [bacterium]
MRQAKKHYSVLFFDLDGTLLDFDASEREALLRLCKERGIEASEAQIRLYHAINDALWKQLEKGEIGRKELQQLRFVKFFEEIHCADRTDGRENELYKHYLSQSAYPLPYAEEILGQLSLQYQLYLVSNGNTSVQNGRLDVCGFRKYFQGIFLSEDIGYAKPDARFFDACLAQMPKTEKGEILLIGDSLSSDMAGGRNAQIDTCWYHPNPEDGQRAEFALTYQIQTLPELLELLRF